LDGLKQTRARREEGNMSIGAFSTASRRIAALHGAPSAAIQELLLAFARTMSREGLRVAGVVEIADCKPSGGCKSLSVRDLTSGETFSISQDLGAGSMACNLDPAGLLRACGKVEQAISEGADLVILSKFGKLEAARSGLSDAFRAAVLADIPVLTAVPAPVLDEWERFAGPLSEFVDPRAESLEKWWLSQYCAARA
jgi:nucleoside-triphosphatase THEP1